MYDNDKDIDIEYYDSIKLKKNWYQGYTSSFLHIGAFFF